MTDTIDPKHAATMLLSLIQGLGFQFAIARVASAVGSEAERLLALYIQALMAPRGHLDRARTIVASAKRHGQP